MAAGGPLREGLPVLPLDAGSDPRRTSGRRRPSTGAGRGRQGRDPHLCGRGRAGPRGPDNHRGGPVQPGVAGRDRPRTCRLHRYRRPRAVGRRACRCACHKNRGGCGSRSHRGVPRSPAHRRGGGPPRWDPAGGRAAARRAANPTIRGGRNWSTTRSPTWSRRTISRTICLQPAFVLGRSASWSSLACRPGRCVYGGSRLTITCLSVVCSSSA